MKNLNFEAVIFDMDGVITKTALTHASAWKKMFDEYFIKGKRNMASHSAGSLMPTIIYRMLTENPVTKELNRSYNRAE